MIQSKKLQLIIICFISINIIVAAACKRGPKIIKSSVQSSQSNTPSTGIFSDTDPNKKIDVESHGPGDSQNKQSGVNNDVHTVVVNEVLPTQKYVYLNVSEGEDQFWIATGKQEIAVGNTYHFHGGLLKRNFESKEYDRIFEKVILVTNLVPNAHQDGHSGNQKIAQKNSKENAISAQTRQVINKEGSIKISEIVDDPNKFAGKTIQISGECVKLNANIMGRNWIHLKDGSKDDYDFVITSVSPVPEGHAVTMTGVVTLNKDFGAGYLYDIIVEQGQVVN